MAGKLCRRASRRLSSICSGLSCIAIHFLTPMACTRSRSPGLGPKERRFRAWVARSSPVRDLAAVVFFVCQPGTGAANRVNGSGTRESTRQPAIRRVKRRKIQPEARGMAEQLHKHRSIDLWVSDPRLGLKSRALVDFPGEGGQVLDPPYKGRQKAEACVDVFSP